MRSSFFLFLCFCSLFFQNNDLYGQGLEKKAKPPSSSQGPGIKKKIKKLPQKITEFDPKEETIQFTAPGIAGWQGGKWVGTSRLLRIPNLIPVYLEITQFEKEDKAEELPTEEWKTAITSIFEKEGISTGSFLPQEEAQKKEVDFSRPLLLALPFFHVQIILFPVASGYIAGISGRLFQETFFPPLQLPEGYSFQAITWEKSLLAFLSSKNLADEMRQQLQDLATQFVDMYHISKQSKEKTTSKK